MMPGDDMTNLTIELIGELHQAVISASTAKGFESTPIWISEDPRSVVREAIKTMDDLRVRIDEVIEHMEDVHRAAGESHVKLKNKYSIRVGKLMLQDEHTRSQLTKALMLDDSHGPMPASLEFILQSIEAVVQMAAGPSAKLTSEPQAETERERVVGLLKVAETKVKELEAIRDAAVEGLMRMDGRPASGNAVESVWRMALASLDKDPNP